MGRWVRRLFVTQWDSEYGWMLSLAGRHVIANVLGALAAASVWGIGAEEAREVLRGLKAPSMRGEFVKLSNGAAVINDSYNSSPAALQAMIAVLAATPGYRRQNPGCGRDARVGRDFAGVASRGGEVCGARRDRFSGLSE